MPKYRLSDDAEQDLAAILRYGVNNYGIEIARAYRDRLVKKFQSISEHPAQYPRVAHVRPGYRRCVFGTHSIYFRVNGNTIEVVRVLGRQDIAVLRSSN